MSKSNTSGTGGEVSSPDARFFELTVQSIIPDDSEKLCTVFTEQATQLYEDAIEQNLARGHGSSALKAAALYLAGRQLDIPVSPAAIASEVDEESVDRDTVLKTRRAMGKALDLAIEPADPLLYVEDYCQKLDLPSAVRELAVELVKCSQGSALINASPTGQAAAAIYAAAVSENYKLTQADLCEVADVSQVTIRTWYPVQIDLFEEKVEREALSPSTSS